MTDSFVTQCPHCQTSFRVSHAQLSVARGVVRCGSCLQVFNAAKQLLEQRSGKSPAETQAPLPAPPVIPPEPVVIQAEAPAKPAQPWKASAIELDSLDLDDLDLDEELARLEQREIQLPETFGREGHSRHDDSALSARRDSAEIENEQWVDSLLNDDAQEHLHVEASAAPETAETPEPTSHHRTEPSLSLDSAALDDEPEAQGPRLSESQSVPQPSTATNRTPSTNRKSVRSQSSNAVAVTPACSMRGHETSHCWISPTTRCNSTGRNPSLAGAGAFSGDC